MRLAVMQSRRLALILALGVGVQSAFAQSGTTFDHADWDALVKKHVDADGWVRYAGFQQDAAQLDAYLQRLAAARLAELPRDEQLALLINAYNACTVRLILDFWDGGKLKSIQDIPEARRWKDVRWAIGGKRLSLDQIENQEIRPVFNEARIHFAVVCAAVGCPKLRNEAFVAAKLEQQLEDQTRDAHSNERWFKMDRSGVALTKLYEWYGGDFEKAAGSVPAFAARYSPPLRQLLDAGKKPAVRFLDYDWSLNDVKNRR